MLRTARIIHVEPTDKQWEVIDSLFNPHVGIHSGQTISAYEVIEDNQVSSYLIHPDGTYVRESLENGFHNGWTSFDHHGNKIDQFHD